MVRTTAEYYRVKPARVEQIIREVHGAVEPWRSVAGKARLLGDEIEIMANAFKVDH